MHFFEQTCDYVDDAMYWSTNILNCFRYVPNVYTLIELKIYSHMKKLNHQVLPLLIWR